MNISLYRTIPADARDSVFVNTVPLMNIISHEIEDVVINNGLRVDFYAGFQRYSYFARQEKRYRRLAAACRRVYVFGLPDVAPPAIPGVEYIPLTPQQDLAREWFLVVDTPEFFSSLLTEEITYGREVPKGERRFRGVWTYDEELIGRAYLLLAQALGHEYRPVTRRDYAAQNRYLVQISNRLVRRHDRTVDGQAAAQHQSALLRAGIAQSDTPLLLLDGSGAVMAVSHTAAALLGLDQAAAVGQPFHQIAGEQLRPLMLDAEAPTRAAITTAGGPTLASATPIPGALGPLGWVVAVEAEGRGAGQLAIAPALQRYLSGMQQLITMLPSLTGRPEVQQRVLGQLQKIVTEMSDHVQQLAPREEESLNGRH